MASSATTSYRASRADPVAIATIRHTAVTGMPKRTKVFVEYPPGPITIKLVGWAIGLRNVIEMQVPIRISSTTGFSPAEVPTAVATGAGWWSPW